MECPPVRPIELRHAESPADIAMAATIFREYADSLPFDLCFQHFDAELAALPGDYGLPTGLLMLAWVAGEPAGCGAFRPLAGVTPARACEMKRLYVRPAFRRDGVGRALARTLLDQARRAGYTAMFLDTLDEMAPARGLYASLGFIEVLPYYDNPIPGTHYLMADLTRSAP